MHDIDQRLMNVNQCAPPTWPHTIVVNQVIGERSEQEAFDIHICIPRKKPSAEQIINVFVKKLRITNVHLITDKVIVRGCFEVKAIYVGCMPCQPVHAVEIRGVRFTVDLPIRGARCGMEADASAIVEYIDYDDACGHKARDERYKNKYGTLKNQYIKYGYSYDDECHDDHGHHHQDHCHDECHDDHGHHHQDHCHDECHDDHGHHHQDHCHDECHEDHGHHHHQSCCCPPHKKYCSREFDVSVVLCVNAKVMVDREIKINPSPSPYPVYPKLPFHPKG